MIPELRAHLGFAAVTLRGALGLVVAVLVGCSRPALPAVELELGEEWAGPDRVVPRSAWAEHLVVPGVRNELRIVLTTGRSTCERYVPPEGDEILLAIMVTSPLEHPIGAGVFPFVERPAAVEPGSPRPPLAVPKVVHGTSSFQPQPGGGLELTRVEAPPAGTVAGVLAFAFPGRAGAPATSIKGMFQARSCTFPPADAP